MNPVYLHFENFMGYISASIDCTLFNKAIIIGKSVNDKKISNGVGKTTLFNAIKYACTGTSITSTLDRIIKDDADYCKVIYDFENNNIIYRIERFRSIKSSKSYLEFKQKIKRGWKKLTQKTPTETQAEINKIIKINSKGFDSSVYFAQNELTNILYARPVEKLNTLKEAFNLNVYSQFEKIAKKKRDAVSKSLDIKNEIISSLGEPQKDIDNIKKSIVEISTTLDEKQLLKEKTQASINNSKTVLLSLKNSISTEDTHIHDKIEVNNKLKIQTEEKINSIKARIDENNKKINLMDKELISVESKIENLKLRKTEISNSNTDFVYDLQLELKQLSEQENDHILKLNSFKNELSKLDNPIPEDDICPSCRQSLDDEYRKHCKILIDNKKIEIFKDIDKHNSYLLDVRKNKQSLILKIEKINKINGELSKIENSLNIESNNIKNKNSLKLQIQESLNHLNSDLRSYEIKLSDVKSLILSLQDLLKSVNIDSVNNQILKVTSKLNNSEKFLLNISDEISSLTTKKAVMEERKILREHELNKLNNLKKEAANLKYEYRFRQMAYKSFCPAGIPSMIIESIIPDLQIETNKILYELRPELEIQLSINDSEGKPGLQTDFFVGGRSREYSQISGGQMFMLSLSLRWAISLIIQKKLGIDIRFLLIDEVDSNLDEAGIDSLYKLIKKWSNSFKIFMISHNQFLKSKFDYVILVEEDAQKNSTARLIDTKRIV